MEYTAGIDIGGTFTDCVVVDPDGRIVIGKASSTPPNFEDGVIDALTAAAGHLGRPFEELIARVRVFHACTVGTNALVEGRTARVGLLVTAGHKEPVFVMRGGGRLRGMSPDYIARLAEHSKPAPLVPRSLVGEIHGRIASDGNVLVEIDEVQVRDAVGGLLDRGVEAFAISFLWSVVNPDHERAVQAIVEEMAPGTFVSRSSEVVPRAGEYERTIGTIVNALVGPVMRSYLQALRGRLGEVGYRGELGIMSCWGGLIDAATAERFPLLTIGSGPAAGVVAAQLLSSQAGAEQEDVITADMGGTTFDVGLVLDGQPVMRSTSKHDQYDYAVPTLDVRSVGAGGGSIIRFDDATGTLRVGPQSAGARPGPAAFLRGGTEATVTDADLVLGYLNPEYFLEGSMALGLDAARAALERAGAPLGFTAEQTAAAAARIIDSQMADAIGLVSVQQGRDPRHLVLYAYGGNGPVHAPAFAANLGVQRVVVPLGDLASGWSALGVAASEVVILEEAGTPMLFPFDPFRLDATWRGLEERALGKFELQGVAADAVRLQRLAEIKYTTQVHQLRVVAPEWAADPASVERLVAAFEAEYERLYGAGTGYPQAGFALTSVAVRGSADITEVSLRSDLEETTSVLPQKGTREVIWYETGLDAAMTPVYDGARLRPGMTFEGPAIVEFPVTTLVVRPGQRVGIDRMGNVSVELAARGPV